MVSGGMWLKRVLVPLWVIEIIVMGIFFILACIVLSWSSQIDEEYETNGALTAGGALIVSITALCIILTIIEIILFGTRKLNAVFHLVSATVKSLIWLIYFFIVVAGAAVSGGGSALYVVLSLVLVLCALAQLIYGSVVMHRVRKGVYGSSGAGNNAERGAVTYEAEDGGYKMASSQHPEGTQSR